MLLNCALGYVLSEVLSHSIRIVVPHGTRPGLKGVGQGDLLVDDGTPRNPVLAILNGSRVEMYPPRGLSPPPLHPEPYQPTQYLED